MYPWISIFGFNFVKKSTSYTWTFTIINLQSWKFCKAGLKFCKVDVLQKLHIVILVMMSPQQHTRFQTSTFPKWKMPHLLLKSLTDFLVLLLWNVHIHSHPLNEQQEQITILEGGKLWFYPLNREGLEPILLPWKCYSGQNTELCDESNKCAKFQFHTQKVFRDIAFFVILHHFEATLMPQVL